MKNTNPIHIRATSLGFDGCGIVRSRPLDERRAKLTEWLQKQHHGGLAYMERHCDKRLDPALLFEGACSVVVCAISYNRPQEASGIASRIASYAWGRDYHLVLKEKLRLLLDYIRELHPGASGRVFVDTAPILEKAWAVEAGLGWIGRHSLLIMPGLGSFVVLGIIVTDAELEPISPSTDPQKWASASGHATDPNTISEPKANLEDPCGKCRACVDACPAGAIQNDRTIDASRCISRHTIEKGDAHEADLHGWIFGCDICQRACPHNRHTAIPNHDCFAPVGEILEMTGDEWLNLSETEFTERFGETPLSRCGLQRIQARIRAITQAGSTLR